MENSIEIITKLMKYNNKYWYDVSEQFDISSNAVLLENEDGTFSAEITLHMCLGGDRTVKIYNQTYKCSKIKNWSCRKIYHQTLKLCIHSLWEQFLKTD